MKGTIESLLTSRKNRRHQIELESFVLRLLEEHFSGTGVQFELGVESKSIRGTKRSLDVDGIVKEGVNELEGPTLVEVQLSRTGIMLRHRLDQFGKLADSVNCRSVLFVTGLSEPRLDRLRMSWEETYPETCLLYTSPSPRDRQKSRMPSSA